MNSALIIRGGAIGDFILTLPALHALKEHFPGIRVEIMGYPHIACLADRRYYAAAITSMNQPAVAGFFARRGELDPALCQYFSSFDLVVSYLYDPDRIFRNNLERAGVTTFIAADCKPDGSRHAADHFSDWLGELQISRKDGVPKLYPSEKDLSDADEILNEAAARQASDQKWVGLHIGSGSPTKNWPMENFLELIPWLRGRKLTPVIFEGPADIERSGVLWKHPASAGCLRCSGQSLPVAAAVLKQCKGFVGHDSGISHLAVAVGTPSACLFGPTDPAVWGPRGKHVRILRKGSSTEGVALDEVKNAILEWI